ncbi:MAG: hypothetical protein U1E76_05020 [Planctomycetota bacterium]
MLTLGGTSVTTLTSARLFDFGGLVVSFRAPLPDVRSDRLHLSRLARFQPPVDAAREIAAGLIEQLHSAIARPHLDDLTEAYTVFDLRGAGEEVSDLERREAPYLAELLRGEGGPLSAQEIRDALKSGVSFSPHDLVIADYDAALLWGLEASDVEDVFDILEFANSQLLELRTLDRRLDRRITALYGPPGRAGDRRGFRPRLTGSLGQRLNALAELKLDSALLAERLQNAFKIIGDLYYARIYRAAAQRLHLEQWERSTERKLDVVSDIYDTTAKQIESRRLEALEWIVMILILVEVVMGFLR